MIRLTDEERAELERRRAAGGHRSLNETVKAWLQPDPIRVRNSEAMERIVERATKAIKSGKPIKAAQPESYGKRHRGFDPVTNEEIWE